MSFITNALNEIKKHNAPGYHVVLGHFNQDDFYRLDFPISEDYKKFVCEIGYGDFFGAQLRLFGPKDKIMKDGPFVRTVTDELAERLLVIGNNGTTEGDFCLTERGNLVWLFSHDLLVRAEGNSFASWVEKVFKDTFNSKAYSFYTSIKDQGGVYSVISERKKFFVKLFAYDKKLVKEPGNEKAVLPRYNKLTFLIERKEESCLNFYTVKCKRIGSIYGDSNVEYVSIPLDINIQLYEVYLFDPFNVEFQDIQVDCTPDIDLSSKMRVKYKELSDFL